MNTIAIAAAISFPFHYTAPPDHPSSTQPTWHPKMHAACYTTSIITSYGKNQGN